MDTLFKEKLEHTWYRHEISFFAVRCDPSVI